MSGVLPPPPPGLTPPAHVARLERSVQDLYKEHRQLESVVGANHLSVTHTLGRLADMLQRLEQKVDAIAAKVGAGP